MARDKVVLDKFEKSVFVTESAVDLMRLTLGGTFSKAHGDILSIDRMFSMKTPEPELKSQPAEGSNFKVPEA